MQDRRDFLGAVAGMAGYLKLGALPSIPPMVGDGEPALVRAYGKGKYGQLYEIQLEFSDGSYVNVTTKQIVIGECMGMVGSPKSEVWAAAMKWVS
jgi:hypothetical protein